AFVLADLRQLPLTTPTPLAPAQQADTPPKIGGGMKWQDARDKMLDHCKHGLWLGVNEFARKLNCSGSTITKAIERTPRLAAIKAEAEAAKKGSVRAGTAPSFDDIADPHDADPA